MRNTDAIRSGGGVALSWRSTSLGSGDKIGAQQYTSEQRERFYRATCAAIEAATRDCTSKRERRTAEREAILAMMEQFGLITRTWGSGATSCVKCEGIT